jgi:hypothetical protein
MIGHPWTSMLVGAVMPRQNTALALEEFIRRVAAKDITAAQSNRNTRIDFSSMCRSQRRDYIEWVWNSRLFKSDFRVIPANFVPIYSRVSEPTLRIAPLITKNEWKPNGSENLVSILEELAGLEALPRQFTPAARKLFAGEERRDEAPTL